MSMLKDTLGQIWENEGLVSTMKTAQTELDCSESEITIGVILNSLACCLGAYVIDHLEDFAEMLPGEVLGMMDEAESMIKALEKDTEDD